MADYSITFARSARKELESLDAFLIQRIFPRIEALAKEPTSLILDRMPPLYLTNFPSGLGST